MFDDMEDFPFGVFIVASLVTLLLLPWWLWLGVGVGLSIPWWKKWRFKKMKLADQRTFFVDNEIFDKKAMMYLGTTQEGTLRWWYMRDGSWRSYMVPQAIDDGKVYWDKKVEIKNPMLIVHLNGFAAMGNEWPEYYKTTTTKMQKNKSKKKKPAANGNMIQHPTSFDPEVIKAVASKLPRADYVDAVNEQAKFAGTAAMAADRPLMELVQAVQDLEKDATGVCPTIDFGTLARDP